MSRRSPTKKSSDESMESDKSFSGKFNIYRTASTDRTRTDESLGILDMDGLSGFGDDCGRFSSSKEPISERLRIQRLKALKTLEKVSELRKSTHNFPANDASSYTSDAKTLRPPRTPGLDGTDYVPYRRNEAINTSDLIADHTIEIQSISSIATSNKISFEPSEITGRSTMCIAKKTSQRGQQKSVKEILAQSYAADVRSLSETLPESYDGNASIRTFDKIPDRTNESDIFKSTFSNCRKDDDSEFLEENFTPAEFMNSKLAADEMAWEQQFATIPTSNQSKKLSPESRYNDSRGVGSSQSCDFSIGDFFNKRSGNLVDMMPNLMSPTKRPAFALVEDSMRLSNKSMMSQLLATPRNDSDLTTPKIDDKTYSRYIKPSNPVEKEPSPRASVESYLLSVSAITNALNDLQTDCSSDAVMKRFYQAKNINKDFKSTATESHGSTSAYNENIAEKENVNPSELIAPNKQVHRSSLEPSSFENEPRRYSGNESAGKSSNQLKPPMPLTSKSRKRSRSSARLDSLSIPEHETPIRRSRSPSSIKELTAASGATKSVANTSYSRLSSCNETNISPARSNYSDHTITQSDRLFLVDSKSPDCGKFSLPNYGLVSRSTSSLSTVGKSTRCTSQCSNSSEFSHRNGKLPLKATCLEVSWGSVKLRTAVQKTIQIKNTSDKRLSIKAQVSGPGFQIVFTQEHGNSMTLQSQECRTIYLSFCPTVIGSATGQLVFMPPSGAFTGQQIISLYGYGGHASVIYHGISKGPIGSPYLPMGELRQLSSPLEMSFMVQNKGPLTGFACMIVDSIGLDIPRLCDCIEVIPKSVQIPPEGRAKIRVIFRPRREDIKKIIKKISEVMTLANLRIICGDDVTRQRIRNLIRQMNDTERSKVDSQSLSKLWTVFPDEKPIQQLELLKEKTETAFELISMLRIYEIAITLNHSVVDNTVQETFMFPDNDETIMFRTMLSTDTSMCSNTNDMTSSLKEQHAATDSIAMHRNSVESWSVRPTQLEIDPFDKKVKTIFKIRNNFFIRKTFRVDTNFNHILKFSPVDGELLPGDDVEVTVQMHSNFLPSGQIHVEVFVENEKIILPVKVKKDKFPAYLR